MNFSSKAAPAFATASAIAFTFALTLTLTLTLVANRAHADDYLSPTEERVRLSLGFVHASSTTEIRADSSFGVEGTPINAENDFGLDKSSFEPKFQAMVRIDERNRLYFDYYDLDRTGQKTLTAPIVFRDVLLDPGDPLQSDLSLRILSITYGYSIIHRQKFELALTLSVNDADISARARVTTQTRHVDQREDQAGPLPTPGLDATYVISKRFYVDARAQYLKATINDLTGSLEFYEFDALYRLRPNVAFALGYNAVKADLVSSQSKQSGYFNFDSKGPELFVRVAF